MAKILIADDEAEVRRVINTILASGGYEVIESSDGEAAYDAAVQDKPDLILLDIMMPFMNGFEVLEKLKSNPATKAIPVIIVTALDGAQDENRGTQAGALDYITKPWAPGELEDRIRIALPDLDSAGPSSPGKDAPRRTIADLDDSPPLTLTSASSVTISSGSDHIDRALLGGIPLGSLTLLEGATGTGKTVICQHLAYGALMAEMGVAFYVQGITPSDLVKNMMSLGLDVTPNMKEGQFLIYELEDFDRGGLTQLMAHIKELPWDMNVIIFDPLTRLVTEAGFNDSMSFFMECKSECRLAKAILISLHTVSFDPEMLGRLNALFSTHLSLRTEGVTRGLSMATLNVIDVTKVKDTHLKRTASIFFEVDPELGRSMNMSLKVLPLYRVKL